MLLQRVQILPILQVLPKLKTSENFTLTEKYNLLKIEKTLKEESELNYALIANLNEQYGEEVEGQILIKEEFQQEVLKQLKEFNSQTISIPDIYFTIDRFEKLDLTWNELEALMPFIK